MKAVAFAILFALAPIAFAAKESTDVTRDIVVVPSGTLRLRAFFWKPTGAGPFPAILFNHGSGTDAAHTGPFAITETAEKLAPHFVRHGYAFFYLFRRGQGPSADQGQFIQDALQREKTANGEDARKRLQFRLLTTDQLNDVTAGLLSLTDLPGIDAGRVAIVGHSFGGQLALLAAERDHTLRAIVTFGAGAQSWETWAELRERLLAACRKTTVPIMFIHAANDYSTVPGQAMDDELSKRGRPHLLKIYPSAGKTSDDGHNFVYTAVDQWEADVFKFLDQHVKRP